MMVKSLPVILWVLVWQVSWPMTSACAQDHATPVMLNGRVIDPPAPHRDQPVAADDYRIDIQEGVTVDAYNLVPLAEHDAARTQSMIDGISGRQASRGTGVDKGGSGQATSWLPRPATAALWLAGLMAVVLMALRYRR